MSEESDACRNPSGVQDCRWPLRDSEESFGEASGPVEKQAYRVCIPVLPALRERMDVKDDRGGCTARDGAEKSNPERLCRSSIFSHEITRHLSGSRRGCYVPRKT